MGGEKFVAVTVRECLTAGFESYVLISQVWIEFVGQGMAKDVGSYREGTHRQKVRARSER
jgi:hypothetical protein